MPFNFFEEIQIEMTGIFILLRMGHFRIAHNRNFLRGREPDIFTLP